MEINNKTVFKNLIWRFAERIGAQGVALVVSIILARILEPEVYGQIALISVFQVILEVFVDSGLGSALIQKKNADEDDFTSVFCFNIILSVILYGGFYAFTPIIANFYNDASLIKMMRVAGITILIAGVKNIQLAYVSRTMQFKKFFISTLGGTVTSGIIGIALAYKGYGAWALVVQNVSNAAIDTCILWITVKWRPNGKLYLAKLRELISYGWKLLVSALIDNVYNNLRSLVIGKIYSAEDLAYYNKGMSWPNLVVTNINTSIDSVLLPAMALEQEDKKRIKQMVKRSIGVSTYVMAPMMLGLFSIAPVLVSFLLTDKWLPIVPYMRIFCITYLFYSVHTANLNAIKAMGRSDLFLKLEILKKIVGFVLLIVTMWFGPMIMAYSLLIECVLCQIINAWPNKKLLDYAYLEQLKDILPNLVIALIMSIIVSAMEWLNFSVVITLLVQVVLGVIIYTVLSALTRNENYIYLWDMINSRKGSLNK